MNKKQVLGMVAAALIFVFVGASSILTRSIQNNRVAEAEALQTMITGVSKLNMPIEPYIGVVKVEGTIMNSDTSSLFATATYQHQSTLDYIDDMIQSDNNKGILLYVDSPGGSVYDSDELYLKLKEYSETTNRPIWTYMGSMACSGGYYISMASDKVYANRNSWTGSIGVIISLTNVSELYEKLGIKEVDITSGSNKAMGSSGLEMTQEHRDIFQSMVDESYEQFVGIVAEGRNLTIERTKELADGRIYTAKQALDANLIDGIDSYENVVEAFKEEIGEDVILYTPKRIEANLASLFSSIKSFKAKSDAEIVAEFLEKEGNGVPMYYAKPGEY